MLREAFEAARAKIGRPDLRFHDLRAEGATLAARVGATVAELQARLGHATPNMAMKYQRVRRNDRGRSPTAWRPWPEMPECAEPI